MLGIEDPFQQNCYVREYFFSLLFCEGDRLIKSQGLLIGPLSNLLLNCGLVGKKEWIVKCSFICQVCSETFQPHLVLAL